MKDVPYVQQGFFTQIRRLSGPGTGDAKITLRFLSTPSISPNPTKPIQFFADYIINDGNPQIRTKEFFLGGSTQFTDVNVPDGSTIIFGIQYIYDPKLNTARIGATPTESASSRGYVLLKSSISGEYAVLSTVRQVFTTFDDNLKPISFSESAYALPLISTVTI